MRVKLQFRHFNRESRAERDLWGIYGGAEAGRINSMRSDDEGGDGGGWTVSGRGASLRPKGGRGGSWEIEGDLWYLGGALVGFGVRASEVGVARW